MISQVTKQLKNVQGITFFAPTTGRFDLAIELKAMAPSKSKKW